MSVHDQYKAQLGRKGHKIFAAGMLVIAINLLLNWKYEYMPGNYTLILVFGLYVLLWLFNFLQCWWRKRQL